MGVPSTYMQTTASPFHASLPSQSSSASFQLFSYRVRTHHKQHSRLMHWDCLPESAATKWKSNQISDLRLGLNTSTVASCQFAIAV